MPFVNQLISFDEFMGRLRQRIEQGDDSAALVFFKFFLAEQLPRQVREWATAPNWDGQVNAGDFDDIYPMAAEMLRDAATREASEVHPETYEVASAVSSIFCAELNELFQCSGNEVFDFIPIKSYSEMMAEAGLVNLSREPDGQTMVSLSEEGQRIAREVGEEIERERELN